MTTWIKLAAVLVVVALSVSVFVAWKDARQQQAALQAELKNTQQALADATARQTSRDAALNTLLAQLNKDKVEVQKPDQVIAALPKVLPLPQPVTLSAPSTPSTPSTSGRTTDGKQTQVAGKSNPLTADFPVADLKPLYDFAVDCKSCQAQLAAAQADLKDEQTKEQALSRERDAALREAKGGSVFRRVVRAAKWFAIGAAAGAIAAKAVR